MPTDLKDRFLANRDKPETRSAVEIWQVETRSRSLQGNPQDISYANIIALLEKHNFSDIMRMSIGNSHLTKPMTPMFLARRCQTACKYFAEEQGLTISAYRNTLNIARRANGLQDLAPSYVWPTSEVPQHLKGATGRKPGSLSKAHQKAGRGLKKKHRHTQETAHSSTISPITPPITPSEPLDDVDTWDPNDDLDAICRELSAESDNADSSQLLIPSPTPSSQDIYSPAPSLRVPSTQEIKDRMAVMALLNECPKTVTEVTED